MPKANSDVGVSIADKLQFGKISIDQFCALSGEGKTRVYDKIKRGEIPIEKHGSRSLIDGPVALALLRGASLESEAA